MMTMANLYTSYVLHVDMYFYHLIEDMSRYRYIHTKESQEAAPQENLTYFLSAPQRFFPVHRMNSEAVF